MRLQRSEADCGKEKKNRRYGWVALVIFNGSSSLWERDVGTYGRDLDGGLKRVDITGDAIPGVGQQILDAETHSRGS